jgi:hypothetical protein
MSSDKDTPIEELKARVAAFAREREWDQFHSPKNLSMALAVEAAELLVRRHRSSEPAVNSPVTRNSGARLGGVVGGTAKCQGAGRQRGLMPGAGCPLVDAIHFWAPRARHPHRSRRRPTLGPESRR